MEDSSAMLYDEEYGSESSDSDTELDFDIDEVLFYRFICDHCLTERYFSTR